LGIANLSLFGTNKFFLEKPVFGGKYISEKFYLKKQGSSEWSGNQFGLIFPQNARAQIVKRK